MKVHETAFITCAYRASEPGLSGDGYAHLFGNELTDRWVNAVIEVVSPHEPYLHCLRNRHWLDTMKEFFRAHPDGVLVNWGAGFSMYPYLIGPETECLDVDQTDIIVHKAQLLEEWTLLGKVPPRKVSYIEADFRNPDHRGLTAKVKQWIAGRPSFFVLEGVLYFLAPAVTDRLFETMAAVQTAGDQLGCVSFLPEAADTAVQKRLDSFFDRYNITNDTFSHQLLSTESYHNRHGYRLTDHQDYCTLSARYTPERAIADRLSILNENMYLLQRV